MFLPIRSDRPLRHTPYVNYGIIIGTLVLYLLQLSVDSPAIPQLVSQYAQMRPIESTLILDPQLNRPWTLVTYAFLHDRGGLFHILGNMVFLWVFGNQVNDKLGGWAYAGLYVGGAIFAGLAHSVGSISPVLGASGAVAAVTGAYIALLPKARVTILYFFFLIGTVEIPGLWLVAFYFLFDLLSQSGAFGNTGVAHLAHLGGTLFGLGMCLAMLKLWLLPRDQFDMLALIDRANRRRQFRDAVNQGYDPFGPDDRVKTKGRRNEPAPIPDEVHDLRAEISEALAINDIAGAAEKYDQLRRLAPNQALPVASQLTLAGYYQRNDRYPEAAASFEALLHAYPRHDQADQARLMLGLTYARHLHDKARATEHLEQVVDRLSDDEDRELAQSVLHEVRPATPTDRP
jgi:membrane associated rhomboid family serine protease